MLFSFGPFWKGLFILLGSWALYGAAGFEFVAVTMLALILTTQFNRS